MKSSDDIAAPSAHDELRWSVLIPAYNEENYLEATVASIKAQTRSNATLILVDNASTDSTRNVMEKIAQSSPERKTVILSDDRPGKINAYETGIKAIDTELVALCDADTIYPPRYLEQAEAMMRDDDSIAAAFAFGVYEDASPLASWFMRTRRAAMAAVAPKQGHTGGYGQSYRTKSLRAAGGFAADVWPFMVADHEIVNRILKVGKIAYSRDHYCITSSRRGARNNVDWRLHERLLYNVLPHSKQDWFFYDYLRPRFEARKMYNANLRDRDWEDGEA